jgi:hypothetical protein
MENLVWTLCVNSWEPRGEHLALSTYENLVGHFALSTYDNLVGLIDLREPRGTHLALSTYENLVENTFAVLNYENLCRAHDITGRPQPGGDYSDQGGHLSVTAKTQLSDSHGFLTIRTSYRKALGYKRLYYFNWYSRYADREALNARLRAPLPEIHREYMHSGNCEVYAGMRTRISSSLPMSIGRWLITGLVPLMW